MINIIVESGQTGGNFFFSLLFNSMNLFLRQAERINCLYKFIKISRRQKGKIREFSNFLSYTKIAFRDKIYSNLMLQFTKIIFITGHSDCYDIGITGMVK